MDWHLQKWQKVYLLVQDYQQNVAMFSYEKISEQRTDLFRGINGYLFFYMKLWPAWTERLFWKKPLTDQDSFKLLRCPPLQISKWILTSQFWNTRCTLESKL